MSDTKAKLAHETVLIVAQFLHECGYHNAARQLECEARLHVDVARVRDDVLSGRWDHVDEYLQGVADPADAVSADLYYRLRKCKVLDHLSRGDVTSAVRVINLELYTLTHVRQNAKRSAKLCELVIHSGQESAAVSKAQEPMFRSRMADKIEACIKRHPGLQRLIEKPQVPQGRLRTLINQALNFQHSRCDHRKGDRYVVTSLLVDHRCPPSTPATPRQQQQETPGSSTPQQPQAPAAAAAAPVTSTQKRPAESEPQQLENAQKRPRRVDQEKESSSGADVVATTPMAASQSMVHARLAKQSQAIADVQMVDESPPSQQMPQAHQVQVQQQKPPQQVPQTPLQAKDPQQAQQTPQQQQTPQKQQQTPQTPQQQIVCLTKLGLVPIFDDRSIIVAVQMNPVHADIALCGSANGAACVFSLLRGAALWTLPPVSGDVTVNCVRWSSNAENFAIAYSDHSVVVGSYSTAGVRHVAHRSAASADVVEMAFVHTDAPVPRALLIVSCKDAMLHILDISKPPNNAHIVKWTCKHELSAIYVSYRPVGVAVLHTIAADRTFRRMALGPDCAIREEVAYPGFSASSLRRVSLGNSGSRLLAVSPTNAPDKALYLINDAGVMDTFFSGFENTEHTARPVIDCHDGANVFVVADGRRVLLYSTQEREPRGTLPQLHENAVDLSVDSSNTFVAVAIARSSFLLLLSVLEPRFFYETAKGSRVAVVHDGEVRFWKAPDCPEAISATRGVVPDPSFPPMHVAPAQVSDQVMSSMYLVMPAGDTVLIRHPKPPSQPTPFAHISKIAFPAPVAAASGPAHVFTTACVFPEDTKRALAGTSRGALVLLFKENNKAVQALAVAVVGASPVQCVALAPRSPLVLALLADMSFGIYDSSRGLAEVCRGNLPCAGIAVGAQWHPTRPGRVLVCSTNELVVLAATPEAPQVYSIVGQRKGYAALAGAVHSASGARVYAVRDNVLEVLDDGVEGVRRSLALQVDRLTAVCASPTVESQVLCGNVSGRFFIVEKKDAKAPW
eukprot:m51a1_g2016 hypothetical protein (1018) ;mRNA; r:1274141-1278485